MAKTISRLYNSHAEARRVVSELESSGVKHGDISVLVSNADSAYDEKTKSFPDKDLDGKDDRAEGAAAGGGVGATVGGAAGLLAGLGLVAIPGVGPVVAAGWLVAALTGAVAGGATGGIIGALSQQAGISDEDAQVYAEGLRRGGALVSVKAPDEDASRILAIMDRSSVGISDRRDVYRKSGWTTYSPTAKPFSRDEVLRERSLYR
jgi:hypothetical protein